MFVKCRPKISTSGGDNPVVVDDSRLILWENFSPQGQPFSRTIDISEYDLRNNCTFFCDVEVSNSTEETLISVGRDISTKEGNNYPRSVIHFQYPVAGVKEDDLNIYTTSRRSGAAARRNNYYVRSSERYKIALNSNGVAINGVVLGSIFYYDEYFLSLYSDLTRPIEIGSTYNNHSNQY